MAVGKTVNGKSSHWLFNRHPDMKNNADVTILLVSRKTRGITYGFT